MRPLPPAELDANSTGTRPAETGATPTPSARVESRIGETHSPLSSLSIPVSPTNENVASPTTKKLVGSEEKGGALPYVGVGAKVHPGMYRDLVAAAARDSVDQSDIIREGLKHALEERGYNQSGNLDAPANGPVLGSGKKLLRAASQYKDARLQEAARLYPNEVATALRHWVNPENHQIILRAVQDASTAPVILRPLRTVFGSYAGLRDVLVIETGVPS